MKRAVIIDGPFFIYSEPNFFNNYCMSNTISFKEWVDEYFFNSSVDLEILMKAYNSLVPENQQVQNLNEFQDD